MKLRVATAMLLVVIVASIVGIAYYLSQAYWANPRSSKGSIAEVTPTSASNATVEPVVVRINYTVIEDPGLKAIAWDMVRWLNWTGNDIAVLKITVGVENRGNETVYYSFGGPCLPLEGASFEPFTNHDGHRGNIFFNVTTGQVFDVPRMCLLVLISKKLQPGERDVYEYYYVVTRPFKGIAIVKEEVCPDLRFRGYKIIESHVEIDVP